MSAWASCYEMTQNDLRRYVLLVLSLVIYSYCVFRDGPDRIPIGEPLLGLRFEVSAEDRRLLILGKGCVVDFSTSMLHATQTEDYVDFEVNEDGKVHKIYLRGRVSLLVGCKRVYIFDRF